MQLRLCEAGVIDYIMSNILLHLATVIPGHIMLSKIVINFQRRMYKSCAQTSWVIP